MPVWTCSFWLLCCTVVQLNINQGHQFWPDWYYTVLWCEKSEYKSVSCSLLFSSLVSSILVLWSSLNIFSTSNEILWSFVPSLGSSKQFDVQKHTENFRWPWCCVLPRLQRVFCKRHRKLGWRTRGVWLKWKLAQNYLLSESSSCKGLAVTGHFLKYLS